MTTDDLIPALAAQLDGDLETQRHWHVEDHYTCESRVYAFSKRALMRQWVRRHGGEGIVVIEACDEPACLLSAATGGEDGER